MKVDESRRAGARVVMSMVVAAGGLVVYIAIWGQRYSDTVTAVYLGLFAVLFAGGWTGVLINGVIFARAGRARRRPSVTRVGSTGGKPSGTITDDRMENHAEDGTITLDKLGLSSNEWRKLAGVLSAANWRWTRRLLIKTHIWESLTQNNRYDVVSSEFEHLEAVEITRYSNGDIKRVKVLPFGRVEICRLAKTPLL